MSSWGDYDNEIYGQGLVGGAWGRSQCAGQRSHGRATDPVFQKKFKAQSGVEADALRQPAVGGGLLARPVRAFGDLGGHRLANHGGRQANGGLPALDWRPDVVAASGDAPVLFDSGIRTGGRHRQGARHGSVGRGDRAALRRTSSWPSTATAT